MQDMIIISGTTAAMNNEMKRVAVWAEQRGAENGLSSADIADLKKCILSALTFTLNSAAQSENTSEQKIGIAIHFSTDKAEIEIIDEGNSHDLNKNHAALEALGKNWQHDLFFNCDIGVNQLSLTRDIH